MSTRPSDAFPSASRYRPPFDPQIPSPSRRPSIDRAAPLCDCRLREDDSFVDRWPSLAAFPLGSTASAILASRMRTGDIQAIWWRPETPSHTVGGTLRLSWDERPTVVTHGSILGPFEPARDIGSVFGKQTSVPLIYGRAADGKALTLVGGRLAVHQLHFEMPEAATFEIVGDEVFVGAHVDPDTTRFHRAFLLLEGLLDWRAPTQFTFDVEPSYAKPELIRLQAQLPDDIAGLTPEGLVTVKARISTNRDRKGTAGFETQVEIEISHPGGLTGEAWRTLYARPLRQLASLALGRGIAVERLEFSEDSGDRIELVWKHKLLAKLPDRALLPDEVLFSLADLNASFGNTITNWLRASRELEPVFDLFFGIRDAETVYEEDRFGNLSEAVEAYHRRRVGDRPDPVAHAERVDRILGSVQDDDRDWLQPRLETSGEYRLSERILGLIDQHPWLKGAVVPTNAKRWAGQVAAERNYRAHHDPKARSLVSSGSGLLGYSMRLTVLLEACLLSELGFDESTIEEALRRASPAFRILALNPGLK